ncbi:NAD(P)-dependent oxidoreductase [Spirillospora sp. CA-294931]|uniref:NAD(P)-dependent oxidoreductase n=1 Tax=Spirillospora sp. CA-294931 TaxID=3240042 RepID=UPI003D8A4DD2
MSDKTPVTVIGLGAMGTAMARTFLANGHPTTVWNRTPSKAAPLVAEGASLAASAADALRASELVVISQLDYHAMRASLESSGDALKGRTLVNLSSDTPKELRAAAEWTASRGADLLTGGIMTPPSGIGQPGSYVFYSGPERLLEKHRGTLAELGDTTYVGADPGLAMLYYQAQLHFFWSTLTSYMHATALLGSAGVKPETFRPYAAETLTSLASEGPMGFLKIVTQEIEAAVYPGEFNSLHMQAVGMAHVLEASRDAGLETTVPAALKALFDRAVAEGHGAEGLTSVIESIKNP